MRIIWTLFLIILTSTVSACANNSDSLVIINQSGEPIASVTIAVCRETLAIGAIQPGAAVKRSYPVRGDCSYKVTVRFDAGRKMEKELGYVTSGFDYEHEIAITNSEVLILTSKVLPLK